MLTTYQSLYAPLVRLQPVSELRRAESCHRREPKTVPTQTAEITKCHVISIVFFKFQIEIAGGDGINQFLLKIRAF